MHLCASPLLQSRNARNYENLITALEVVAKLFDFFSNMIYIMLRKKGVSMKKNIIVMMLFAFMVACSDDSSSSSVNATDDGASLASGVDSTTVLSNSSSMTPPYGVVAVDTTTLGNGLQGGEQSLNDDNINITSSSKTEYRFETERTLLYEVVVSPEMGLGPGWINAYYGENGIQFVGSGANGSYAVTYRLLEDDSHNKFVGWLWNLANSNSESCETDRTYFESECGRLNGEFVDYRKEDDDCVVRKLWLSCVSPLTTLLNEKETLDSIALDLKNFITENWATTVKPESPTTATSASSAVSASSTSP